MSAIHPSAVIDARAELGDDVSVGAFSIIEGGVRIGARTRIEPHVIIRAGSEIGDDNHIYQFCSIGEAPQHQNYRGEKTALQIGARNIIRESCTLHRGGAGGATRIGDDNFLMAYAHIAHDCMLGGGIVFANGASLAGHVEVGDHAILGGFTLVHQFCRIGAHCITGIGAVCFQDVPPFMMAAGHAAKPFGLNIKGLRRRGFDAQSIALLKQAYALLYRSGIGVERAREKISALQTGNAHLATLCDFLARSKRGIIR